MPCNPFTTPPASDTRSSTQLLSNVQTSFGPAKATNYYDIACEIYWYCIAEDITLQAGPSAGRGVAFSSVPFSTIGGPSVLGSFPPIAARELLPGLLVSLLKLPRSVAEWVA